MPPRHRFMRRSFLAALLPIVLAPIQAFAHAILEESVPAQDGSVPQGQVSIVLRYNSRIDKSRSRLVLIDSDKAQTALPIVQTGAPDMLVSAADLKPGAYAIRWSVLAVDGHLTRGEVRFTVTEH